MWSKNLPLFFFFFFFANDGLIFGRATVKESSEILRILKVYKESSGQQLNKQNTPFYFNHNTTIET